jgi:hypothetical protein
VVADNLAELTAAVTILLTADVLVGVVIAESAAHRRSSLGSPAEGVRL